MTHTKTYLPSRRRLPVIISHVKNCLTVTFILYAVYNFSISERTKCCLHIFEFFSWFWNLGNESMVVCRLFTLTLINANLEWSMNRLKPLKCWNNWDKVHCRCISRRIVIVRSCVLEQCEVWSRPVQRRVWKFEGVTSVCSSKLKIKIKL